MDSVLDLRYMNNAEPVQLEIGGGDCAMTFFDMDGSGFSTSWILGDTFIRTYCNIHDIANKQIGFAKAIHTGL